MKTNIIRKEHIVREIQQLAADNLLIALVNFTNVTSLELKEIRQELKNKNIFLKVIKNTLTKKALQNIGNEKLIKYLYCQKLLIFSNDIKLLVTILYQMNKINNNFKLSALYLYDRIYFYDNYYELSTIGTKEAMLIKFLVVLKTPIIKFINNIKYPYVKLITLLKILEINIKGVKNVYK
ncbi:MAG TPA: 50S ribosomal protein L10 [Candidatus Azoamicus sp. OHIO2]